MYLGKRMESQHAHGEPVPRRTCLSHRRYALFPLFFKCTFLTSTADCAHCHSPAGGQGLNSSVQDSANLGWKLALVHKGLAPDSLLDTYAEERLRVIAQMLQLTTALYAKTFDSFQVRFGVLGFLSEC